MMWLFCVRAPNETASAPKALNILRQFFRGANNYPFVNGDRGLMV